MIVNFYLHNEPNCEGVTLEEIWQWSYDRLEQDHSYIQWLFPLEVPSAFNPDAPILTEVDKIAFAQSEKLRGNMRQSLEVFLGFLGLVFRDDDIVCGDNFEKRVNLWRHTNHNWLRITRILKSLRLCGLAKESMAFFLCLSALRSVGYATENTFQYWMEAAGGDSRSEESKRSSDSGDGE